MVVIKRYPNRKLYDSDAKKYITLDGVSDLIREGKEVQIIDHHSGEDLTAVTLTQIILEQEKKQSGFLPRAVLTGLVKAGGDTMSSLRQTLSSSLDLLRHVDEEIEKRIWSLVRQGEMGEEDGRTLLSKLLSPNSATPPPPATPPNETELENFLSKKGIPTQKDLQKITEQLDALSAAIENINPNQSPPKPH